MTTNINNIEYPVSINLTNIGYWISVATSDPDRKDEALSMICDILETGYPRGKTL